MKHETTVSFFGRLGPGLLLAATSIGASHLVMAPKAGWMFGFQLLWLVPLTHLFKYHVFMVAAFTAMYSTVYAVMDGFSRSFAETVSTLFPKIRARWQTRLYWGFVLFTAAFAFLTLVALKGKNPIALVLDVGFLSLCIAPLYCVLNYICVTRLIEDERFRPGTWARLLALAGIIVVGLGTLVCAAAKFGLLK